MTPAADAIRGEIAHRPGVQTGMGAHPYWYFVPYREDLQSALDSLREREFRAGRYNPVIRFIKFREPAFSAQNPGPQHKTIKAAVKAAAEDGTRSILDVERVGTKSDYGVSTALAPDVLEDLYGTTRPTRAMLEGAMDFLDDVSRGHCVHVVLYEGDRPSEIFFGGYSFD